MKLINSLITIIVIVVLLTTSIASATPWNTRHISGNITTPDGDAVSGSFVTVKKTSSGEEFSTTTDSSGRFILEVPQGMYKITYTYESEIYSYKSIVLANRLTDPIDIVVDKDIYTKKYLEIKAQNLADIGEEVSIKVIDRKTGEPVNDSEIYVRGSSVSLNQNNISFVVQYGKLIGKTNENGDITYVFNETGRFFIKALKDGYVSDIDRIVIRSQNAQPISIIVKGSINLSVGSDGFYDYSVEGTRFLSSVDFNTNITKEGETGIKSNFETNKLKISVHDNLNGLLNFEAKDDTTVEIELPDSASIEKKSKKKVMIKSENMKGTLLIAGDGYISVKDDTLTVELGKNSQLIFKAYPGEKDSCDEDIEDGIVSGDLYAEIHVFKDGENESDSIEYFQEIDIQSIDTQGKNISVTVDSPTEDAKMIVITIDNNKLPADPSELSVKVDGEKTLQVSSIDDLFITGSSNRSRSLVYESEINSKVFVMVNHFSKRTITIEEDVTLDNIPDEPSEPESSIIVLESEKNDSDESSFLPGFEAIFAIVGFLAVAYILRRVR